MNDLPHIISAKQFTREFLEGTFLPYAESLSSPWNSLNENFASKLRGLRFEKRSIISLFYQESTRTRASFESAIRLGSGSVLFSTQDASQFSAVKGESLEHTVCYLSGIGADAIILRHPEKDAPLRAAKISHIPIINAGAGLGGEHPTQALLDIYTIRKIRGRIDNLEIAIVGDLNGRTVMSLTTLLSQFKNVNIYLVSPPGLDFPIFPGSIYNSRIKMVQSLAEVPSTCEIFYMTRIQKEYYKKGGINFKEIVENAQKSCFINKDTIRHIPEHAHVLHPMPISEEQNEIHPEVQDDPRMMFFKQAWSGVTVRTALLHIMFNRPDKIPCFVV